MKARPEAPLAAVLAAALVLPGFGLPAAARAADTATLEYRLQLTAGQPAAEARIRVRQATGALRQLTLDSGALVPLRADGALDRANGRLSWRPPAKGGELRYRIVLDHRRSNGAHDALVTGRYGLFRGEDAFPVRSLRRKTGAELAGRLALGVPRGWSTVLPYRASGAGTAAISNRPGRMVRPVGWIIAGDIGVRREIIGGLEVTVSAPRGLRMERLGMLALLRWTLPRLLPELPEGPGYVSIVAAGDPFWLGALAAPNSIYVHAARPLISENGTSTIIHEMVHVLLMPLETASDQDWIDEGLAEYLALRALYDSGTVSPQRYRQTLGDFRRRGAGIKSLRTGAAAGAVTARAVTIFQELDEELRRGGGNDLTDLVQDLVARDRTVTHVQLRAAARELLGRNARALEGRRLPGLD